jgi:hypothetical protein
MVLEDLAEFYPSLLKVFQPPDDYTIEWWERFVNDPPNDRVGLVFWKRDMAKLTNWQHMLPDWTDESSVIALDTHRRALALKPVKPKGWDRDVGFRTKTLEKILEALSL